MKNRNKLYKYCPKFLGLKSEANASFFCMEANEKMTYFSCDLFHKKKGLLQQSIMFIF